MELEKIEKALRDALQDARRAGREDVYHDLNRVVKEIMDKIGLCLNLSKNS